MLHRGYYKKNAQILDHNIIFLSNKVVKLLFFKGVFGCDMHFYKLFELKCVFAVGSQPPCNDKDPPCE